MVATASFPCAATNLLNKANIINMLAASTKNPFSILRSHYADRKGIFFVLLFALFTEVLSEKCLHGTIKIELIFLIVKAVSLVIFHHVLNLHAAFP